MAAKTVDEYIAGLEGWQADVAREVRRIILATVPDAVESIKWAQPVYASSGPFAYFKAFKHSLNFGFWRGADLDDPTSLLQGTGQKMRHVRLTKLEDIDEEALSLFVRQAVQLNADKGDPTKG